MRNDIVIFRGPSITSNEANKHLQSIYLPPAMQGDMYRAYLKYKPKAMGLIDGNFECIPSPWHKEILYLMSQGVNVFGSSSMGALRASELNAFGMVGIGKIYDLYNSNTIEDDDEVAITHAPSELDYLPISVAMVDIRETLLKALNCRIISKKAMISLESFYKNKFYKDRNYQSAIDHFKHIYVEDIKRFKSWISFNKVEQKKNDAVLLLKAIQNYASIPQYNLKFKNTIYWHNLKFIIDKQFKETA